MNIINRFICLVTVLFLFAFGVPIVATSIVNGQKPIVIIVTSYKNERWCDKNLTSIFTQNYENYRVIYIDDCSPDKTYRCAKDLTKRYGKQQRMTLIRNQKRVGAMENHYDAVYMCDDDEIIVHLDGDDWFMHKNVLQTVNRAYGDDNVWLTYGQNVIYPTGEKGYCGPIPKGIIKNNSYRDQPLTISHLRTFYAWLFKQIKREDFMYEGKFLDMTWDKAMMFPMIEMSGGRFKFIPEVLYVYNCSNPINDHKVNRQRQYSLERFIMEKPKYEPIDDIIVR